MEESSKDLIKDISIIIPCQRERKDLLVQTLRKYDEYFADKDINVELIIVSSSIFDLSFLSSIINIEDKNLVIYYNNYNKFFNPVIALNKGISFSKYDNVIITCPEVAPIIDIFGLLTKKIIYRGNYIFRVIEQTENGELSDYLSCCNGRIDTPSYYFLSLFKKENIIAINGWDENFSDGIFWESLDFGRRFIKAGFSFINVKEPTVAVHMYHNDSADLTDVSAYDAYIKNQDIFEQNKQKDIIKCRNGIINIDTCEVICDDR